MRKTAVFSRGNGQNPSVKYDTLAIVFSLDFVIILLHRKRKASRQIIKILGRIKEMRTKMYTEKTAEQIESFATIRLTIKERAKLSKLSHLEMLGIFGYSSLQNWEDDLSVLELSTKLEMVDFSLPANDERIALESMIADDVGDLVKFLY